MLRAKILENVGKPTASEGVIQCNEDMTAFLNSAKVMQYNSDGNARIDSYSLREFLNNHPDIFARWQTQFKQDSAFFNNFPDLIDGRVKLLLAGVAQETLEKLQGYRLLHHVAGMFDEYEMLYETIKRIAHYENHYTDMQLWELLCLSGKPECLQAAFSTGHLINFNRETKNKFGENIVHLAVLSNSCKQISQAQLHLGKLTEPDTLGITPIKLAQKYRLTEMVAYLNHLLTTPGKHKVSVLFNVHVLDDKKKNQVNSDQGALWRSEVQDLQSVNFGNLAARITKDLSCGRTQVAESHTEANSILNQHSFYRVSPTFYTAKVEVDINDLEGPLSEAEMSSTYNARGDKHWLLKANTLIDCKNIIDISLCHNRSVEHCISGARNPEYQPGYEKQSSPTLIREKIHRFLSNPDFWKNQVYSFKTQLGYELIPEAAKQLIELCETDTSFRLLKFKEIAAVAVKEEYKGAGSSIYALFSQSSVVNSLFKAIATANSFYEIGNWIDNYEALNSRQVQSVSRCVIS